MAEQQIAKLAGVIVEHQQHFGALSTEDCQWVIQNTVEAIAFFVKVIKSRNAAKSQDATRVFTLNETTIAVNLGTTPKPPFVGAEVESHTGEGWAIVEKRADGLYVNGRKVVFHLSKRQKGGIVRGHELREELTDKPVLNPNILDALYDNPHLIPEDWKKYEQGNIRYIFFWGTIFRGAFGGLCVLCLCFDSGAWSWGYYWLDDVWGGDYPAALLASI